MRSKKKENGQYHLMMIQVNQDGSLQPSFVFGMLMLIQNWTKDKMTSLKAIKKHIMQRQEHQPSLCSKKRLNKSEILQHEV